MNKPIYSIKDIKEAFQAAERGLEISLSTLVNHGVGAEWYGLEIARQTASAFEQVMRASLRLDETRRDGRPPETKER